MIGTAALHLSKFFILAGLSACPGAQNVNVDIHMDKQDSPYVTNLTSQQLTQNFGHDMTSTMATDGKWMVSGVTVLGPHGLGSQYSVKFAVRRNPATNESCLAVSDVQYTIKYAPVIYIASDYLHLGCRYSATLQPEKRHVDTDVRTITDYIPQMRGVIEDAAEKIGAQGPYPDSDVKSQQDRIIGEIDKAIGPAWKELLQTRQKRQAEIDTLKNYMRDTALCPGQFPKFDGGKP